jgi:hypothetical protein
MRLLMAASVPVPGVAPALVTETVAGIVAVGGG